MVNKLLMPLVLKNIVLPGRAVRSATEFFCSTPDAHVRPSEIPVYSELAGCELGLIVTANTCVSPGGRSNEYQNAIWSDEYIEDSSAIARAASSAGTPVIMQLGHGGHQAEGCNGGRKVLTPDNMTKGEIKALTADFAGAAGRAMQAGFSGVMIHAAHTFLLSAFFYPDMNRRTDEYGGCAENRFRLIREIYEAIKNECGNDTPVFMKINGDDRLDTAEYHADLVTALRICSEIGMDAVEISGMDAIRSGRPKEPYFINIIHSLHRECDIPLISVGGVRTPEDVEELFAAGASAVSFSRPLIQDPGIVRKLVSGGSSDCIGCHKCFTPVPDDSDPRLRCPMRKQSD